MRRWMIGCALAGGADTAAAAAASHGGGAPALWAAVLAALVGALALGAATAVGLWPDVPGLPGRGLILVTAVLGTAAFTAAILLDGDSSAPSSAPVLLGSAGAGLLFGALLGAGQALVLGTGRRPSASPLYTDPSAGWSFPASADLPTDSVDLTWATGPIDRTAPSPAAGGGEGEGKGEAAPAASGSAPSTSSASFSSSATSSSFSAPSPSAPPALSASGAGGAAVRHPWRWVGPSALAWVLPAAVLALGAGVEKSSWSVEAVVGVGALTGVVAGALLGAVLGALAPAVTGVPVSRRLVLHALNTRMHRFLPDSLVGIAVRGRRSGVVHHLPVTAVPLGTELVILPAHPERKQWWRNLEDPAHVRVCRHGRWDDASARVVRPADPAHAPAAAAYAAAHPKGHGPTDGPLVVVSLTLTVPDPAKPPTPALPPTQRADSTP